MRFVCPAVGVFVNNYTRQWVCMLTRGKETICHSQRTRTQGSGTHVSQTARDCGDDSWPEVVGVLFFLSTNSMYEDMQHLYE